MSGSVGRFFVVDDGHGEPTRIWLKRSRRDGCPSWNPGLPRPTQERRYTGEKVKLVGLSFTLRHGRFRSSLLNYLYKKSLVEFCSVARCSEVYTQSHLLQGFWLVRRSLAQHLNENGAASSRGPIPGGAGLFACPTHLCGLLSLANDPNAAYLSRTHSSSYPARFWVPGVIPLAYIGNVSRTTASVRVSCGFETFSIRG